MPSKQQNEKTKKNIERNQAIKKILKLYVLPLGSMGIFLLIVIFLIIPKIGEIFGALDEISQDESKAQTIQTSITQLQTISSNSNQMLAQLNVINTTTPTGKTEVVAFRDKITALIQNSGLKILEQRLSETNLATTDQTTSTAAPSTTATGSDASLSLQEVPFSFQIQGNYDSLINFIKDLSAIDDFIIVKQMQLATNGSIDSSTTAEWILKLTINKYQFSEISQASQDTLYSNVPIDATPNQSVLDYVNARIK